MAVIFSREVSIKLVFIFISSLVAALGTMIYAFRFVDILNDYNPFLFLFVGGLLAFFSVAANTALGSYSLLNANIKQNLINPYGLAIGSFVSAIPYGFICYFGYEAHLSFFINLPMSLMVVAVNTGIAYSAIYNFLIDFFKNEKVNLSNSSELVGKLGFSIGLLVSLTTYVATVHGLYHLFISFSRSPTEKLFNVACILGILSWIPFAALYTNSTKIVAKQLYAFFSNPERKSAFFDKYKIALLIVAIGSGASFSQIAIDFFDPSRDIPDFLKSSTIQLFIHTFIVPAAFFSSAAVNYLALQRLFARRNESHKTDDFSPT